jgi:hypothetical protein
VDPSGVDLFGIFRNIRERKAVNLEAGEDRIAKMVAKDYTIV